MTSRKPLPEHLRGRAFSRAGASVGDSRLRARDLSRPWRGVRSDRTATTAWERCEDYSVRLKPGQFFSHGTAALLHGLPVPQSVEQDPLVHVAAVRPADAPHATGVVGYRVSAPPPLVTTGGVRYAAAHEVLCQLAASLSEEDLVVIADHLLNATDEEEEHARALLLDRAAAVRRIGSARLVRAIRLARRGSGSPAETRIRLVLAAAGAPRPELNVELFDSAGRYLGKPDFVWREQRVLLEYEGAGHREAGQFRYDVRRYEEFADAGWRVMRATGDDLTAEGRKRLARRLLAALA